MKSANVKRFLIATSLILCSLSVFAAPKSKSNKNSKTTKVSRPDVWILDMADGFPISGSTCNYWHDDNSGDSGYSYDLDFTANAAFALPQKGDRVRLTGKIISDIDLPYLNATFNDDAKEWLNLTWGEEIATDIKAGVPYEIDHEFEIRENSNGRFRVGLGYDLCWGDYGSMEKIGKAAHIQIERVNKSTDSYEFKTSSAEKWVIDICDSDIISDGKFQKNNDSTLCFLDRKYNALFTGVFPRKGDFIEVNIRGVSDTDIPHLNIQLVDNGKGWQEISTAYWPSIEDIKAGVPFSAKFLFPVDNPPKDSVMIRFHYDGEWEREWRKTPDVGKQANFTFERSTNSFDVNTMCEKIGITNIPKVFYLDFADSNLGSTIPLDWDDNEWAKCYRNSISFRHLIRGDMPKKGDIIVLSYNMTIDKDIPYLAFQLFDGSKANSWHNAYSNDYLDFNNLKAGVPVAGKIVSTVKEDPLFDVNVQLVYDANWQLENHPAAGYSSVASIQRVSQSTHTVTPRAPKTYKIDFTKIAKSLLFKTFDEEFNETNEMSEIKYYSADLVITSLFKKDDLPRKGDTVELIFNGSISNNFNGITFGLWESNNYVWWNWLGANVDSEYKPIISPLKIEKGKKLKYSEKIILVMDADISVGMSVICTK